MLSLDLLPAPEHAVRHRDPIIGEPCLQGPTASSACRCTTPQRRVGAPATKDVSGVDAEEGREGEALLALLPLPAWSTAENAPRDSVEAVSELEPSTMLSAGAFPGCAAVPLCPDPEGITLAVAHP